MTLPSPLSDRVSTVLGRASNWAHRLARMLGTSRLTIGGLHSTAADAESGTDGGSHAVSVGSAPSRVTRALRAAAELAGGRLRQFQE